MVSGQTCFLARDFLGRGVFFGGSSGGCCCVHNTSICGSVSLSTGDCFPQTPFSPSVSFPRHTIPQAMSQNSSVKTRSNVTPRTVFFALDFRGGGVLRIGFPAAFAMVDCTSTGACVPFSSDGCCACSDRHILRVDAPKPCH